MADQDTSNLCCLDVCSDTSILGNRGIYPTSVNQQWLFSPSNYSTLLNLRLSDLDPYVGSPTGGRSKESLTNTSAVDLMRQTEIKNRMAGTLRSLASLNLRVKLQGDRPERVPLNLGESLAMFAISRGENPVSMNGLDDAFALGVAGLAGINVLVGEHPLLGRRAPQSLDEIEAIVDNGMGTQLIMNASEIQIACPAPLPLIRDLAKIVFEEPADTVDFDLFPISEGELDQFEMYLEANGRLKAERDGYRHLSNKIRPSDRTEVFERLKVNLAEVTEMFEDALGRSLRHLAEADLKGLVPFPAKPKNYEAVCPHSPGQDSGPGPSLGA